MMESSSPVLYKPKTLSRTLNTALICWKKDFTNIPDDATYILQIENEFREWKYVYWGRKTEFLVQDLAPCSYYSFRLKYYNNHVDSEWLYFKSGTDSIPYFVMHFTRAVRYGKTPIIRKIINRRPVLLETENKEGKTPLIQAIEYTNFQMVTFLVNLGANVNNATLITKRTPLMVALFNDNLQISNFLVEKGADPSLRDCNSLTAFHHAIDSGSYENVEFCLQHEFDINAQDNKGWTPLLRAVVLNCSNDIIQLLLEKGADATIKDRNGFDFYQHAKMSNRKHLLKLFAKEEKKVEEEQEEKDVGNKVTDLWQSPLQAVAKLYCLSSKFKGLKAQE